MQWSHCPFCYGLLETCEVTPCFICGGWPESVQRFDPAAKFIEFELPDDTRLVLCNGCQVEEFMVKGGWGWQLNIPTNTLPINYLRYIGEVAEPKLTLDKYCLHCLQRLAFIKILAAVKGNSSATP